MQYILYILALSLLTALPPPKEKSRWLILKNSTLSITGHTNVNRFCCNAPSYTGVDTLNFLTGDPPGQCPGIPLTGTIVLCIDRFDCRNRIMTEEFKKTLLSGKYPEIRIRFVSLERMPVFSVSTESVKGWVEIELAGACRVFGIDYSVRRSDLRDVSLTGERDLRFQDFGLSPPRKMGGLLKVNDTLGIRFTLYLQQIE